MITGDHTLAEILEHLGPLPPSQIHTVAQLLTPVKDWQPCHIGKFEPVPELNSSAGQVAP